MTTVTIRGNQYALPDSIQVFSLLRDMGWNLESDTVDGATITRALLDSRIQGQLAFYLGCAGLPPELVRCEGDRFYLGLTIDETVTLLQSMVEGALTSAQALSDKLTTEPVESVGVAEGFATGPKRTARKARSSRKAG